MEVGIPECSVLGPTLWNVLYDEILREDLVEGISSFCLAEELAIVVIAKFEHEPNRTTNEALR